jgi:predicted metal-dependent hydrolase
MADSTDYDRRYLGGILFFNERDFFQAHEVWESLWLDCAGPERRFYQALIQAAVALYHYGNGNVRGAAKLFRSSKAYMDQYASPYLGLDAISFWEQMNRCFAPLLAEGGLKNDSPLDEALIPLIALDPAPDSWPSTDEFHMDDEEDQ